LEVRITVKGKPTYERWTLVQWILEIKDIIESEYGVRLIIEEKDSFEDLPVLCINDEEVLMGLPGEEGYLIEVLKKHLDRFLCSEKD